MLIRLAMMIYFQAPRPLFQVHFFSCVTVLIVRGFVAGQQITIFGEDYDAEFKGANIEPKKIKVQDYVALAVT